MRTVAVIAFLAAAPVVAQAKSAEVELLEFSQKKLGSGKARDAVQGAFIVAEEKVKGALADLRAALLRETTSARKNVHVMAAILDALIRIEAKVKATDLKGLPRPGLARPGLVLVANNPKEHEAFLMRVLQDQDHAARGDRLAWIAAGNLLMSIQSKRFTQACLESLDLRATITVVDSATSKEGATWRPEAPKGRGGGGEQPAEPYVIPKSYPVYGFYQLHKEPAKKTASAKRQRTLLATGPTPIYFNRRRGKKRQFPQPLSSSGWGADRLAFVATMLETRPAKLQNDMELFERVSYSSDEHYQERVLARKGELQKVFAGFLKKLEKRGYLDGKAKVEPSIQIEVLDVRGPRSSPLPEIKDVAVYRREGATSRPASRPSK